MIFCSKCGYKNNEGARFCGCCGANFGNSDLKSVNYRNNALKNVTKEKEGYTFLKSLNMKTGKLPLLMNIIALVLMIVATVGGFLLFEVDFATEFPSFILSLLIAFIVTVVPTFLRALILKIFGCGKLGFQIGLVMDFSFEKPISKKFYILSDIIAVLIPFTVFLLTAINNLTLMHYAVLSILTLSFMANLPLHIFILKQPKGARFTFENGALQVFSKTE